MTTPYVDIVDGRLDVDSPGDTLLFTDIRNDLRHLKELADTVGVFSNASIYDDFVYAAGSIDADIWDSSVGATGTFDTDGQPDHYAHFSHGATAGTAWTTLAASAKKMRVDLDRDHSLVFECRHKSGQSDNVESWFMGLKDASLAAAKAVVTTNDNVIGFRQGTTANKYRAICAKAAASSTLQDDVGDASAWSVLKITVASTGSGASIVVRMYVNGTEVTNSPFSTLANIPVLSLRPVFGFADGGGTRHQYIDYCLAYWTARPLSA